ncbi:MFS DHA1 protein [Mycena belliarum]|uniref:MFS DHA1 protein n=1 Tax=Mycena belliarum TaxID=1033014 RepID=A0AAD6XTA9_9AGAR|nr:MFS DHA1 protein [Mycena belliae]
MNLYYCQPILVNLAESFGVTESEIARVPTLLQAGYAVGLLLISPLGDMAPRRPLLFTILVAAASLSVGLALTKSFLAFQIISFFVAVFTVTPQILIPLTAQLAPENRKGSYISIVISGLLLGVMLARVLAGIVTEYVTFRALYWMAVGGQYTMLVVLYFVVPVVPPANPDLSYFTILGTMLKLLFTQPVLAQAALITVVESAIFSSFWVTMTFLLSGDPYHYNTLKIGLFGLVGLFGVCLAPLIGWCIDHTTLWNAALVSLFLVGVSQAVYIGAAGLSIGAVIVSLFVLDIAAEGLQVSLTTKVFSIMPEARSRLNAVLILSIFVGQVIGTQIGTTLFLHGGWRSTGAFGMGASGILLVLFLCRGPYLPDHKLVGWGWHGQGSSAADAPESQRVSGEKSADTV